MKQHFELRKLRDFGQVFNDTFLFFKENMKPLLRSLFVICGVLMLIGAVSSISTYLKVSSVFNYTPGATGAYEYERHTLSYAVGLLITALIFIVTQSCISLVTTCYISVYLQNKGTQPGIAQVWGYFKYYFWRVFLSSILLGILAGIGFAFCLVPGIYLGVVFSLVVPVMVMENASFGYAFNKSFTLIRSNWWFVFGVLVVIILIVWIANSIAGLPLGMMPEIGRLFSNHSIAIPVVIFFSILRSLLIIAYSLIAIATSLCYFDLTEQKEGVGLLARINEFGMAVPEQETTGEEPAEEY